jgi:hypothetical protein
MTRLRVTALTRFWYPGAMQCHIHSCLHHVNSDALAAKSEFQMMPSGPSQKKNKARSQESDGRNKFSASR